MESITSSLVQPSVQKNRQMYTLILIGFGGFKEGLFNKKWDVIQVIETAL